MNSREILDKLYIEYGAFIKKYPWISQKCRRETIQSLLRSYKVQLLEIEYDYMTHLIQEQLYETNRSEKKRRMIKEYPKESGMEQQLMNENPNEQGKIDKYPKRVRATAYRKFSESESVTTNYQQMVVNNKSTNIEKSNGWQSKVQFLKSPSFSDVSHEESERLVYTQIYPDRIVLRIKKKALCCI
ncbi:uncharacterized protein LOC143191414 [Rhynchophorus ferrugineus]|uniref:uncharacterized protein LOC143191414 n=1 Tax=Rhynchophorus ferrugineus TaxID=354439 RepID=UPI003FCC759E